MKQVLFQSHLSNFFPPPVLECRSLFVGRKPLVILNRPFLKLPIIFLWIPNEVDSEKLFTVSLEQKINLFQKPPFHAFS